MSEHYVPETPECHVPTEHEVATGEFLDLDGDGYAETLVVDTDGDGEIDAVLTDVDADGYDDIAAFDNTPGDGTFVPDVVAVAADADGRADVVFDDTDLDGVFDDRLLGHDEPLIDANPYDAQSYQDAQLVH